MRSPLTGFWIKSHSAILEDVTIATLPDTLWRRYHELKHLLAHDAKSGDLPPTKAIAFRLRVPETQLALELEELGSLGLLTIKDGVYQLPFFGEEQGPDSTKERLARHRETMLKRNCNDSETIRYPEKKEQKRIEEKEQTDAAQSKPASIDPDDVMEKVSNAKKPKPTPETDPDFLTFWQAYPRKVDKPASFRAWKKARLPTIADVLSAIRSQSASDKWQKFGGEYIPYPATWIKGERWNDQAVVISEEGKSYEW